MFTIQNSKTNNWMYQRFQTAAKYHNHGFLQLSVTKGTGTMLFTYTEQCILCKFLSMCWKHEKYNAVTLTSAEMIESINYFHWSSLFATKLAVWMLVVLFHYVWEAEPLGLHGFSLFFACSIVWIEPSIFHISLFPSFRWFREQLTYTQSRPVLDINKR